jgi:hypothetical protein
MSTTNAVKVSERPILFSGPMVRAILDGRKTQTRRVINPQPIRDPYPCHYVRSGYALEGLPNERGVKGCSCKEIKFPFAAAKPNGRDLLWVRETFADSGPSDNRHIVYKADVSVEPERVPFGGNWRPSIFMPRYFSRLTLEITNIRVERLQEISEVDAIAEGVQCDPTFPAALTNRTAFGKGWDTLNAKRGYSWDSNPWVWVIEFDKI